MKVDNKTAMVTNYSEEKLTLISWLILMMLTLLSVVIGAFWHDSGYFIIMIFAIVFIKGQQVTDVFMELKHAPKLWRLLLLGYVLILPAILALLYLV